MSGMTALRRNVAIIGVISTAAGYALMAHGHPWYREFLSPGPILEASLGLMMSSFGNIMLWEALVDRCQVLTPALRHLVTKRSLEP